jgi:large subunit ribosomal protein L4
VKHRPDVQGSTRKLFRQKGTGRARRGDIKSPLLRGGGVVFGPDNRSYKTKLPKKVRKLALKMALSAKLKENNLLVLDKFELDDIKTKKFLSVIKAIDVKNGLFITSEKNEKLELSARNVPKMKILRAEGLNVYDVLKYDRLVLMESTLSGIEERLRS